jgi:acetyltransferase-like isoleucine patch superfamily enzyme
MNAIEEQARGITEKCLSRICSLWTKEGPKSLICELWMRFWMLFAGRGFVGRIMSRLASWGAPPYYSRHLLAWMNRKGYVSSRSTIFCNSLNLGEHVFVDDGVVIYQFDKDGEITIGRCVALWRGVIVQTAHGGKVVIGESSHIHPYSILSACKGSVIIGKGVQIAPGCKFYPYNHDVALGISILDQQLTTRGDIIVEDDVWIGTGVIILDNVRIGKGAVVGAGSVVTGNIPDNAIACGVPATVLRTRGNE